jgi:glycosyltransferase involved in cell wall biosynthesis
MGSDRKLKIGYAGSLAAFDPGKPGKKSSFFKDWFWTYQVDNVDFSTRSGYFLFKALAEGIQSKTISSGSIEIDLWGSIHEDNRAQVISMGMTGDVNISGYLSKEQSVKRLETCDVLFLPLECGKDGNETLFIPGKLFEYLKLGKPVLCLTNGGDCADILQRSGLGILVSPYDTAAVTAKLSELVKMKQSGTLSFTADAAYIDGFSFREITRKMAGEFDRLLK